MQYVCEIPFIYFQCHEVRHFREIKRKRKFNNYLKYSCSHTSTIFIFHCFDWQFNDFIIFHSIYLCFLSFHTLFMYQCFSCVSPLISWKFHFRGEAIGHLLGASILQGHRVTGGAPWGTPPGAPKLRPPGSSVAPWCLVVVLCKQPRNQLIQTPY